MEKNIPDDRASRHALDIHDGMGLATEWTCPLEKQQSGKGAKPSMACPNLKWAVADHIVTTALIRGVPCAECLLGCDRAWGR
jgi:hypothetical protein